MLCWDRHGDQLVVGVFERRELDALRHYVEWLHRFTEVRARDAGDADVADDARVRAIMADSYVDGLPADEAGVDVHDLLADVAGGCSLMLDTLPTRGGVVELCTAQEVTGWHQGLCGMAAVALGNAGLLAGNEFRTEAIEPGHDQVLDFVAWLHDIRAGLQDVTRTEPRPGTDPRLEAYSSTSGLGE
ncbi:MAG: hypothetical protein GEU98_20535 [Pseudonocardiaceae bacterium]|nr:hypothetical protein [Pseudonocardiaceae bacterium]